MNRFAAVSICLLMLLAVAVYRAKTAAGDARGVLRDLRNQIATLEEDIAILRAEEAHLKRPERIENLARSRLGLLPVRADQIGFVRDLNAFAGQNATTNSETSAR